MLPGLDDKPEEIDTGPSVDSENQAERIEARRIRIKKRVEALRRSVLSMSITDSHSVTLTVHSVISQGHSPMPILITKTPVFCYSVFRLGFLMKPVWIGLSPRPRWTE